MLHEIGMKTVTKQQITRKTSNLEILIAADAIGFFFFKYNHRFANASAVRINFDT